MSEKTYVQVSEVGDAVIISYNYVRPFDTRAEAEAFVREFNKKNNLPVTPNGHMYAAIID